MIFKTHSMHWRILIFISLLYISCDKPKKSSTFSFHQASTYEYNNRTFKESELKNAGYEDGTYCAEIEYYNPRTGTTSDYTLTIEVEENRLIRIEWPNGGWLDESHYSDVEISEDGEANFESDRGYEYTLRIVNSNACRYSSVILPKSLESNEDEDGEIDLDEDIEDL